MSTELVNQISFQKDFIATTILHPATYLNKVVIGGANGELQLWNTRTWYVAHLLGLTLDAG
jgi:U3 small nucleolar RNA-associated protein 21